eukprot:6186225-Pleurochrysis_carterae.AAC.4
MSQEVSVEELRDASTLLEQVMVQDRFNPLLHCDLELDHSRELLRTLEALIQAGRVHPEVQNEHFNRRQQVAPVVYYQSVHSPASGSALKARQHKPMFLGGAGSRLCSGSSSAQKVNETCPYMWNTQSVRLDMRKEPSLAQETSQHQLGSTARHSIPSAAPNWQKDQHDQGCQQTLGQYSAQIAITPTGGASSVKPRLGKRRMQRIPITEC